MKTTTGCFRTTSTDALQHETQLLPIELELRKQITKYLTCIQTLPRNHPIKKCLEKSKRYWNINQKRTFISYITDTIEEIHAYIKPPWWTPINLTMQIAKMPKDQVKAQHESSFIEHMHTRTTLCIYTDGSGIQKHIGASAHSPTTNSMTHAYLGKEDNTNVYAAELTGIHLGIKMAETSLPQYNKCIIYVDNQSSIQAINTRRQQLAQYIVQHILDDLEELQQKRPNLNFIIEWVPGHMDIAGNDKADEEAKKAALNQPQGAQIHSSHQLKSAQNTRINANITTNAKNAWNQGKANARLLRKISRPQRCKTGVELYGKLTRKEIINLIRLRTGHCKLNIYLSKRKIVEDPECECGHGIETVKHFLLLCPKYEEQRSELRKEVGDRNMRLENLLGDPKIVRNTLEFVEKTKRFNFE